MFELISSTSTNGKLVKFIASKYWRKSCFRYTVEVYAMPACSINWESEIWTDRLYVAIVFALGLLLPLGVILYCYVRIIQIIREVSAAADCCTVKLKESNPAGII